MYTQTCQRALYLRGKSLVYIWKETQENTVTRALYQYENRTCTCTHVKEPCIHAKRALYTYEKRRMKYTCDTSHVSIWKQLHTCTCTHATRETSLRRGFDPYSPHLFHLYHYLEQNLHFGLVPENQFWVSPPYSKKLSVRWRSPVFTWKEPCIHMKRDAGIYTWHEPCINEKTAPYMFEKALHSHEKSPVYIWKEPCIQI